MIVKPQGGGKTYANTGTCANVASYLQHEDVDRMKDGKEPEPFFSQWNDRVSVDELVSKIDNNRKGLKTVMRNFMLSLSHRPGKNLKEWAGRKRNRQQP